MQYCIFEGDFYGPKKCINCNRVVNIKQHPHLIKANCGKKILDNSTAVVNLDIEKEKIEPVQMPSKTQQFFNLIGSLKDFVENPSFVNKDEYKQRLDICGTCDFYDGKNRCKKCGCFLAIKAKGRAFHCPEKKWPGD